MEEGQKGDGTMIDISGFLILDKQNVVRTLYRFAFLLAFLGSLFPWFLWPLGKFVTLPVCLLLLVAMLISNSMKETLFARRDFLGAVLAFVMLSFYQVIVNSGNLNGYVANFFHLGILFALFRLDPKEHQDLADFLAKMIGGALACSIPFYLYYLTGHALPSVTIDFNDGFYMMENHFIFVQDTYHLADLFPRYQFVFLEPGHLGSTCVMLLMIQIGKWKKWYNIAIFIALFLTFSLTGYVLLVVLAFIRLWLMRKHFFRKFFIIIAIVGGLGASAFFYDQGDNPFAQLILARLEVDDGEMEGDNRVTDDFQNEYETFLESGNIILGDTFDYSIFGSSGYKVYFFDYGLVGIFLVLVFYAALMRTGTDKRTVMAGFVFAFLLFVIRANPLWYCDLIPIYLLMHSTQFIDADTSTEEIEAKNEIQ